MPRERLAFDTRSYTTSADEKSLATNLADIAIEARIGALGERVNSYTLQVKDGNVINLELGEEDISAFFSWETELDRRETRAAHVIRDSLLTSPCGTVAVWFSPESREFGYLEGRVTVGYSRERGRVKEMESYCVPTEGLTSEDLLHSAWRLTEFSNEHYTLNSPEDLRDTAVVFQLPEDEESPWEFLRRYISLNEAWDTIINGEARQLREKALKDTQEMAPGILFTLQEDESVRSQEEVLRFIQGKLSERGWDIDTLKLQCPVLFRSSGYDFIFQFISMGGGGIGMNIRSEVGKFVKNCGKCGVVINAVIGKGYTCRKCGGVYEGC